MYIYGTSTAASPTATGTSVAKLPKPSGKAGANKDKKSEDSLQEDKLMSIILAVSKLSLATHEKMLFSGAAASE